MLLRVTAVVLALGAVLGAGTTASASAARTPAPYISGVRCVPAARKACRFEVRASIGSQVQLRGHRLYSGMRVTFRWPSGALATTLRHKRSGWIAKVPAGTALGKVAVTVRDRARRRSNARHVRVTVQLLAPVPGQTGPGELPTAFRGNGMWIWELPKSERGDVLAIAAKAKAKGIGTVFIKSADGVRVWSQFTPELVAGLRAQGLRVCAWQYVYGSNPAGEAAAAAKAVTNGADCFVIDAESEYQGRYGAAQTYINSLRAAVGEDYPLGLSSFPYVQYHPRLPYSVFLGPGGRAGERAADLLEDDRHHGRHRKRSDDDVQPDLRRRAGAARSGLQRAGADRHRGLPADMAGIRRQGHVVVELAGLVGGDLDDARRA